MAGFFALRRSLFQSTQKTLDPIGYKIGLELVVKSGCSNVVEVPIHFADRLHGRSKFSVREQINYLLHLKRLFDFQCRNWAYFFQFVMIGGSGVVVDLLCFTLFMVMFSIEVAFARGLAIWMAMSWNFTLNRLLTFSYVRHDTLLRQYLGYFGSCLMGAIVNWSTSVTLCNFQPFFICHKLAAAVVGVAAGTIFNYLLCRHFVFRDQRIQATYSDSQESFNRQSSADDFQTTRSEVNNVNHDP